MLLGIDSLDAASIVHPGSTAIRLPPSPQSEYSPPSARAISFGHLSGERQLVATRAHAAMLAPRRTQCMARTRMHLTAIKCMLQRVKPPASSLLPCR
eukprot:scaffold83818_cov35-Tisochrysis_lutea.AAC.2